MWDEHESPLFMKNFVYKIAKGKMPILRLTTPKLKDVWGPVRSG
jgi:hypothetical protein